MAQQASQQATYQAALAQEWESFKAPPAKEIATPPKPGDKAPVHPNLSLPKDKPTVIVFLRHCGCPFAEKVFKTLTHLSSQHKDVHFIGVSHSSPEATERWVIQVGGNWDVEVVIDHERELYAQWGLGMSTTWHVLSPRVLYQTLQLGKAENIWNRPTESGTRWQISGAFAVAAVADAADAEEGGGKVCWAHVAGSADDLPDFAAALGALGIEAKMPPRPAPEEASYGIP
ncbi:hypothetical protein PG994_003839 [Apiospora phragmitis]|uniref:Thioredoxin domain-containing protein n=1 Tax=Apiospora phragmitis TaxID=2905665 RepID=A0ABR1W0I8_9PEZI